MGIIDYLILGFAEIQIAPNDFVKMITLFLKLGIKMKRKNIATVIIMCDKIAEAKSALDEAKINYKIVRVFRAVGSQTDKKKIIATMSALIFTRSFYISSCKSTVVYQLIFYKFLNTMVNYVG